MGTIPFNARFSGGEMDAGRWNEQAIDRSWDRPLQALSGTSVSSGQVYD